MDLEDLDLLVRRSTKSAFRLECRPQYLVGHEEEDFRAWREGRTLPFRTPETSQWLARIQEGTRAGYRWYRVHVLDWPLSDYARFELAGYPENQSAGEEIFLVNRGDHPDLERLREDFWMIDDTDVVRMVYDREGRFLRPERVADAAPYRWMRDVGLRSAVSLDEYLARHRPSLKA